MSDDLRMRAARTWLIRSRCTDEAAEQLAPELLAELDAVDPSRQARGDTRTPPSVMAAIEDVRSHVDSWTRLLARYVDMLDEETDECDRLYAEHELRAMGRDLTALIAAVDLLPKARGEAVEAYAPPFPAWGPEMAELVREIPRSLDAIFYALTRVNLPPEMRIAATTSHRRIIDIQQTAFPDPAREGPTDAQ